MGQNWSACLPSGRHYLGDACSSKLLSFCNMVNGKEGIYENYDAITGEGYCDPAFTWTSSVFLLMACDLLHR
ncbi:hypothetical protein KAX02_04870 [candidate division WOR-3 bacterium]|nr:hypothetical protein [candidate division WOR-3 bacterium]